MLSPTDLVQAVAADLEKIRETAPLVLSLTNSVVQPLTANLLLKTKDGKYAYFVYNMSEKNPDNVAIANQSIVLRVPVTRIAGDPLLEKAKAKARQ